MSGSEPSGAESPRRPARPAATVPFRERRFRPRPVVDVHGRRQDVALISPHPALLTLASWLTPAFYVDFGRPCNSACLYCAVPPHEDAQGFLPLAEVESIVEAGVLAGCDRAILIGGEPTIYPHLFEVLASLADRGLSRHILMTNGLRLADATFLDELIEAGVGTVHLSLDTVDPAVYDQLSRSQGRLPQQLQALANVLARPQVNLYLYVAVTALNLKGTPDLLRALSRAAQAAQRQTPPVVLAVVKPLGDALTHADRLLIDPRDAALEVEALVTLGDALGVPVGHRNLQACLASGVIDRNVDYYLDDYSLEVATRRRLPFSHGEHWFKLPDCADCGHNGICPGLYRDTTARYGTAAYRPIGSLGLRSPSRPV